jgi:sodium ion-translocating decarboxylase, beta subunit
MDLVQGLSLGNLVMIGFGLLLTYLAIKRELEPLILLPIGLTTIMVNLPGSNALLEYPGILYIIKHYLIDTEIVPVLIFLGLGALTDFSAMLANPISLLLGAGEQIAVLITFFIAILLGFNPREAASIGIIGGADGPITLYTTTKLAPHMFASIVAVGYIYISIVPLIQPPIVRILTSIEERRIRMRQLRDVSKREKLSFSIMTIIIIGAIVPPALPLVGAYMLGNILKESGLVGRLSKAASEELLNISTLFLGLGVGSTLRPEYILNTKTLIIVALASFAFILATILGILIAKLLNLFLKEKINPVLGAAGVSVVPATARVAQKLAFEVDPENYILMHATGPNIAGVIGTAVVAGVFLSMLGG